MERVEVDYSDDPWRITEEQREYYTNQFRSLQPDLSALIVGKAEMRPRPISSHTVTFKTLFGQFEACIGFSFRNCCKKLLHQVEASDSRTVAYMVMIKSTQTCNELFLCICRNNHFCSTSFRELSDVDKDGALTFPEFCTAFHLIVARKNGYLLPETLPATLRPGFVEPGVVTAPPSEVCDLKLATFLQYLHLKCLMVFSLNCLVFLFQYYVL